MNPDTCDDAQKITNQLLYQLSYVGTERQSQTIAAKNHQEAHQFPTKFLVDRGPSTATASDAKLDARSLDRFWSKVDRSDPSGCWVWTAYKSKGYGRFWIDGRLVTAHVLAFESLRGPVPHGLQLDHFACRNRACVNPSHLEPVTPRENVSRGLLGALKPGKTSRFVGVSRASDSNRWVAQVKVGGKKINLGEFDDESRAAAAYRSALASFSARSVPEAVAMLGGGR